MSAASTLLGVAETFEEADAERVKAIEAKTNHDVKAIGYWLKEKIAGNGELERAAGFIHFACTSEDINNLAYALMVRNGRSVLAAELEAVEGRLVELAHAHADLPMLARTHGQPATPTTLGKEIAYFVHRLRQARARFAAVPIRGKLNGAPRATTMRISRRIRRSTGKVLLATSSSRWAWSSTPTPSRSNPTTASPSSSTRLPA